MKTKGLSRREFLRIAGSSSVGFVLAACTNISDSEPEATESVTAATDAPPISTSTPMAEVAELVFWHPFGGSREPLMQEAIIDPFNAESPNSRVEQFLWTGSDRAEKFVAAVAAGTPPDVIMFPSGDMPAYADQDAFLSLDDFIASSGIDPDEIYYAAEINARRFKGTTYMLPTVTAAGQTIAYYNAARFEEAGHDPEMPIRTWAEWEAIQSDFVDATGDSPRWFGNVDLISSTRSFWIWLHMNGGKYLSDNLTEVTFGDERGIETMQWIYARMTSQADYADINPGTATSDYLDAVRARFVSGQTAVYIDGPWVFQQLAEEYGMQLDQYRIHPAPYNAVHADAVPGAPTQGGWGNALPANTNNPERSWEFIKFATTTPASLAFTVEQGRPNPVKAYNADQAYYDVNPYWDTVLSIFESDYAIPVSAATAEINQILVDMQDQVMYGQLSPEEALAEAAANAQRALDRVS